MKSSNLAVREDYGPSAADEAPPAPEAGAETPAAAWRARLRRSFDYRPLEQRAITLDDAGFREFRVR
jgi:hypothetical protein